MLPQNPNSVPAVPRPAPPSRDTNTHRKQLFDVHPARPTARDTNGHASQAANNYL
ncbi:hypothetical protein FHU29_003141 [Hoyosella altamirensis]|uniref:Uncharacterized protein n=1 Tax=Hoyosella altamirensis TaxID=616997 RepID=A0A839RNU9_9ACTN|nr:hypothetical protein [Hoyosella altamirensis]